MADKKEVLMQWKAQLEGVRNLRDEGRQTVKKSYENYMELMLLGSDRPVAACKVLKRHVEELLGIEQQLAHIAGAVQAMQEIVDDEEEEQSDSVVPYRGYNVLMLDSASDYRCAIAEPESGEVLYKTHPYPEKVKARAEALYMIDRWFREKLETGKPNKAEMISYRGYFLNLEQMDDGNDGGWYCEVVNDADIAVDQTSSFDSDTAALSAAMSMVDEMIKGE